MEPKTTIRLMPYAFLILLIMVLAGCKHEPDVIPENPIAGGGGNGGGGNGGGGGGGGGEEEVPCDSTIVYFEQQILPILISNCAVPGCHNVPTDDNDDIQITSYATLMGSDIVQDGDMWEVINDNDPDDRMPPPPQQPLSADQIALIGQWIQQGAQNTSCVSTGCDTLNVTYSATIVPIIQQHCQGCHSGGTPQGGLNFTSHAVLQQVAMDGRLAGSIQHLPGAIPMPPGGAPPLSDCKIQKFLIWIDQGAPNN